MMARTQVTLPPEIHRTARARAAQLGVSLAQYIRGLLARDLGQPCRVCEASLVFDLGDSGGSGVTRDKDEMIGRAMEALHPRGKPRRR